MQEGKKYVTVAVGCSGGRHRSVHIVERLALRLTQAGWRISITHRELAREGVLAPAVSAYFRFARVGAGGAAGRRSFQAQEAWARTMIGLVLVTHGRLAEELRLAMEHVSAHSETVPPCASVPMTTWRERRDEIHARMDEVDTGDGVVLLTDMFGGTPSNTAVFMSFTRSVTYCYTISLAIERVVVGRDRSAFLDERVDAHPRALRRRKRVIRPGDGRKSCSGSSAFSRISIAWPRRGARPVDREALARGDRELLAHDVDPGAELGDRMLDLEARVQLDELEAAVRPSRNSNVPALR